MFRADKTVGMLKAIAAIASLAILLWSLGLPSLQSAKAADMSYIKDTISDSDPSASANHTIEFVSAEGIEAGETIVITFPSGFDLSTIGEEDIDLLEDGVNEAATGWSVGTTSTAITLTMGTASIATSATTSILIGTHATNEGSPDSQIGNHASEGAYTVSITAGAAATGETVIVIMSNVDVTASVDTVFTFAVAGVGAGVSVNGETTTGVTSSTSIPFGKLENGTATTSAQMLTVNTNASNGYTVTVQSDGDLQSTTGGIIDNFTNGSDAAAPTAWAVPSGDIGDATTWGHWGVTTDDASMASYSGDDFAANEFVAASTSARVVMEHTGPAGGTGVGVGTTTVAYKVQITSLQEAGDDYSTTLTYIATPTF